MYHRRKGHDTDTASIYIVLPHPRVLIGMTFRKGQISTALVRAIAIHADRIIIAPLFLWYIMMVITRYYGVLKT